jgi:lysophospholipase L1-like esterase
MTLSTSWEDGNQVHGSDLNTITAAINTAATMRPIAASYRPLQGLTSSVTIASTNAANFGAETIPWSSAAGKYRYVGGTPVAGADSSFSYNNNFSLGQVAYAPITIEFWSNATAINLHGFVFNNPDLWAIMDDTRITNGFPHAAISPSGEAVTWTLTPTGTDWHRWRICFGGGAFWGISTNTGAKVIPTTPGFQLAVIGDSYVEGYTSIANAAAPGTAGFIGPGQMFGELQQLTALDVWLQGINGSGYTANIASLGSGGQALFGSTQRMSALAGFGALDAVLIMGSVNDVTAGSSTSAVVAAAQACWSAIKAAQPNAALIVAGVQATQSSSASTNYNTLNAALRTAANASSAVAAFIDLRNPNFITGSGFDGTPENDGNADVFISTDTLHPTHLGHRYWAIQLARLIGQIPLPA